MLVQVEQSRFLVPPFTSGESVFVSEPRKQSQHQVEQPVQQGGTRSILADLRCHSQHAALHFNVPDLNMAANTSFHKPFKAEDTRLLQAPTGWNMLTQECIKPALSVCHRKVVMSHNLGLGQ